MQELEKLAAENNKRIQVLADVPRGRARIFRKGNKDEYYFKEKGTEIEKYISSDKQDYFRKILQLDYENKIKNQIEKELENLNKCLRYCDESKLMNIYLRMCDARKEMISPIIDTDEMYIDEWMKQNPGGQNPFEFSSSYETNRGEMVRSKSEKILADEFYKQNIPYQYEPRVRLNDKNVKFPDFVLLNVKQRKTIYWEHLGMISNEEYASLNLEKLYYYESNGLILGTNLIISCETAENPLDVKLIRNKIDMFLK